MAKWGEDEYGQFVLFCIRTGRMKWCILSYFLRFIQICSRPVKLAVASLEAASEHSQQESGLAWKHIRVSRIHFLLQPLMKARWVVVVGCNYLFKCEVT